MSALPQVDYRQMTDQDFAAYLRMLRDSLKDLPTDTATVYAWKIFLSCVKRFGRVGISSDVDDIVWVHIQDEGLGRLGPFPEAMVEAALLALEVK